MLQALLGLGGVDGHFGWLKVFFWTSDREIVEESFLMVVLIF